MLPDPPREIVLQAARHRARLICLDHDAPAAGPLARSSLEAVLRDFPETRVVISSDWRTLFSLPKLVARFSEDIRPRVIDVTPTIFPRNPNELYGLREREARQWLAAKAPTAEWLAVDDAPGNWPTRPRLVLTDFKQGFTDEDAGRMRRMLDAFRAGAGQAGA